MSGLLYFGQFLLLGSVTLITVLYFYFTRNFNHWKDRNVRFLKPVPFFGNIKDGILMRHSIGEIFNEIYYQTRDPLIGFFVLDRPCLLLKDPQLIKRVLVTDFQYFFDRSVMSNTRDDPLAAHILFILKNPDWKDLRTKITPVFTSAKIKAMSELVEDAARELTDYLRQEIENNDVIEMKEACIKYTVDVITSTAFGVKANSFKNYSEFFTAARHLTDWDNIVTSFRMRCYFLAHSIVKLFRLKMFHPGAANFLNRSFWEIMKQRAATGTRRNDLIDILLQLKNSNEHFMEGDILASQALVFFIAGFETSSSTMTFGLYEMAINQEIQSKLRKEIKDVYTKHGCFNYDALKQMEYLDMCVKEVLRKYPVLPFLERNCNSRYTIPEIGATIEKGTPIFISTLGLQYDPKYFPNPEVFDPERFSKENAKDMENFSYLPFGEGPRNCIGARFGRLVVKLGLAYVLNNFIVSQTEASHSIKYNPNGVVLSPLNGMRLRLIPA